MRDIGVVAAADRLYVYMADAATPSPHYESAGYSKLDTTQFAEWCREKIDAALRKSTPRDSSQHASLLER
jgi:hypothetical protein